MIAKVPETRPTGDFAAIRMNCHFLQHILHHLLHLLAWVTEIIVRVFEIQGSNRIPMVYLS